MARRGLPPLACWSKFGGEREIGGKKKETEENKIKEKKRGERNSYFSL